MTLRSGLICAFTLAADWPPIRAGDVGPFALMAAAGTPGIAFITQAFRMGDAASVAPFDSTALIWATVIGWAV